MKLFEMVLAERFSSNLRRMGFKGDDWQMRRCVSPFIHCVWVQERSDKAAVCLNLGVHLDFIPTVTGKMPTIDIIEQPDCEIKYRLVMEGERDQWWSKDEPEKAADEMYDLFKTVGRAFLAQFEVFPGVLGSLSRDDIESGKASLYLSGMTRVRIALLLARVWYHIGESEKMVEFAEYGMRIAGVASGPKAVLKDLLNKARLTE